MADAVAVAERCLGAPLERRDAASDLELCAFCRAGSSTAFSQLAERYQAPLHAYCARLVGRDHAEDVVQQSLVKAWLALSNESVEVGNPKGWLYRIVHNQAMDHVRTSRTRWEELDPDWEADDSTERTFELRDRLGRVSVAISELPGRQREALLMHTVDGHPYRDIALAMDTNIPAVSQLITRARARLREIPAVLLPSSALLRLNRAVAKGSSLSPAAKASVLTIAACTGAGIPLMMNRHAHPRPTTVEPSSKSDRATNAPGATAMAGGREGSVQRPRVGTRRLIAQRAATLHSTLSAPAGAHAGTTALVARSETGGTPDSSGQSRIRVGIQLGPRGSGASVSAGAGGLANASLSAGNSGAGVSVSTHAPSETPAAVESLTQSIPDAVP
jgi:RNA polymerase sigma-70 factor (ECF subfamily)